MCGRASLPNDVSELKQDLRIEWDKLGDYKPRWNAAPTTDLPVVTSSEIGRALELMRWGDRWDSPAGPPKLVVHRECGHETHAVQTCSHCGEPLTARNVRLHDGPGLALTTGDRRPATGD